MTWVYEYREDPRPSEWDWHEKALLRPIVQIRLGGEFETAETHVALVDSGCDHVLAPEWLARSIGVTPDPNREASIRIAGQLRRIRFGDATIELCAPTQGLHDTSPPVVADWHTQVGFFLDWSDPPYTVILGQCGFFDQFTISMSRHSQRLVVLPQGHFDECFPPGIAAERGSEPPRFVP